MPNAPVDVRPSTKAPADASRPIIPVGRYIRKARLGVALTAPLIYGCLLPFVFLDVAITIYQQICFPIYGIPRVRRRDYLRYDRAKLRYLNLLERVNCYFCSYANGLAAYFVEIAGRTEQHWCPIRHAQQPTAPHSRYGHFLPFQDEAAYRERSERLRRDFSDLQQ